MRRIAVIQRELNVVSETFLRAHAERLQDVVGVIHERHGRLWCNDAPVPKPWSLMNPSHAIRQLWRGTSRESRFANAYETALRSCRPDVVLAEYGPIGVRLVRPCQRTRLPFVVHFHGYDASRRAVLSRYAAAYRDMFASAAAVIAVSRSMEQALLSLDCPRDTLIYSPYGIDCSSFHGSSPGHRPPTFVAVGRLVEKKAPGHTLRAFARVFRQRPACRLRMIGDGPLRRECERSVASLGLDDAVTFLGAQPHDVVLRELHDARAFVQHSVVAADGDAEGTPVAILEAAAAGVPVVATRHAGIPDVVIEGQTGLLVDEHDVEGMANRMLRLADDPDTAQAMGQAAAVHVRTFATMEASLARLERVLEAAANRGAMGPVRESIEREFGTAAPCRAA